MPLPRTSSRRAYAPAAAAAARSLLQDLEHPALGIEPHADWLGRQRDTAFPTAALDLGGARDDVPTVIERELQRQPKRRPLRVLYLFDDHHRFPRRVDPPVCYAQHRVAGPVQPLLEEPVERPARFLLERTLQIDRGRVAVQVALVVAPYAAEENTVAEHAAQHMQHSAALVVAVRVEQLEQVVVGHAQGVYDRQVCDIGFEITAPRLLAQRKIGRAHV